jgi:2-C-methyl-D-erythritol 2,4-cyclodiphosphate synthase
MSFRVGTGYDVHALAAGRRLVLGGIEIPFQKGLAGHSDADALTHAIMDALLGAAGLKDIGTYFPNTDPWYKDADSLSMLQQVCALVDDKGFKVGNVDATIIAREPKMAPFVDEMRAKLAGCLGVKPDQVSVKAKSGNGLGTAGKGEGIEAMAVAMLESKESK